MDGLVCYCCCTVLASFFFLSFFFCLYSVPSCCRTRVLHLISTSLLLLLLLLFCLSVLHSPSECQNVSLPCFLCCQTVTWKPFQPSQVWKVSNTEIDGWKCMFYCLTHLVTTVVDSKWMSSTLRCGQADTKVFEGTVSELRAAIQSCTSFWKSPLVTHFAIRRNLCSI